MPHLTAYRDCPFDLEMIGDSNALVEITTTSTSLLPQGRDTRLVGRQNGFSQNTGN